MSSRTHWSRSSLDTFRQDVLLAVRQLKRSPGFASASILTLGLGIGATTTIFSAVDSVVLRPFAWADPGRVVAVFERWHDLDGNASAGNYTDWRTQSRSFSAMSAEQFSPINLADAGAPERVSGGRVTSGFFQIFGVQPLLGRVFRGDEDQLGQENVAILSYGLWRRRFAGDPKVLNRVVRLNDIPVTIVGVMPAGFDPTASGEELWMPLPLTPAQIAQHDEHYLTVVGWLRPGIPIARAQSELDGIAQRLRQEYPIADGDRGVRIASLSDAIIGSQRARLLTVLGAVSFVLLIACGNVANLLLARGTARAQEFAVRAALGARRRRLVRQLLTESVVLAMGAAVVGLALTWFGIRLVLVTAPAGVFPRLGETRIDPAVLAFAVGISVASAVLFGLAPALRTARQDLQSTLRSGGRGVGSARDVLRGGLIVAEVALALTLLDGAGLLARSAIHLDRVPVGFDARGILTARVTLPPQAYPQPARAEQTFVRITDALQHAAGVTAAAMVSRIPMGPGSSDNGLIPEGRAPIPQNAIDSRMYLISPDYLSVMRIPLIAGREFTDRDVAGEPRVMIVSHALAERAWPGVDPVGKRIICCEGTVSDPRWKTVVGVAADVRSDGPALAAAPEFYLPVAQAPDQAWTWIQRTMTLIARSASAEPTALTSALRGAVATVDPTLPLFDVSSMQQRVRAATAEHRFNTTLLLLLALIGLVLAASGIASVAAFFVSARRHEIGVRIAMGANGATIIALLARQSLRSIAVGLVVGLLAAFATTRFLGSSLYDVSPLDPVTAAVVVVVVVAAGVVAILLPARRAAAVDPVSVLRS
jgi:putative ABC transport system permease protein